MKDRDSETFEDWCSNNKMLSPDPYKNISVEEHIRKLGKHINDGLNERTRLLLAMVYKMAYITGVTDVLITENEMMIMLRDFEQGKVKLIQLDQGYDGKRLAIVGVTPKKYTQPPKPKEAEPKKEEPPPAPADEGLPTKF